MTTVELLEELDARVAALKAKLAAAPVKSCNAFYVQQSEIPDGARWKFSLEDAARRASTLRVRMDLAGVSRAEFAALFAVPLDTVEAWASGERPVPEWVAPAVRLIGLLAPEARRGLWKGSARASARRRSNPHPFARIEDL